MSSGLIFLLIAISIATLAFAMHPLRKYKRAFFMIVPLFFLLVWFAYWQLGSYQALSHFQENQAVQARAQVLLKSVSGPDEVIMRLKQRLEQEPESAKGWFLLGRIYSSQGKWPQARDAFDKSHALAPDDEKITVNYAQSLYYVNQQQFNDPIRSLFKGVLSRNPEQPDALAMLAMDAFQSKQYTQAVSYWSALLKMVAPQSDDAEAIRQAIAKAQKMNKL